MTIEVDCLLHRNYTHNAHTARQVRSHELHVFQRVFVKAPGYLGVSFDLLLVSYHHFHYARNPAGQGVVVAAVIGARVSDDNALVCKLPQKLFCNLRRLAAAFSDLVKRKTVPHLARKGYVCLLVGHYLGQNPVLRITGNVWYAGSCFERDLVCKRKNFRSECHSVAPSFTLMHIMYKHSCVKNITFN